MPTLLSERWGILDHVSCCQSSLRACRISPAPVKTYLTEEILPLAFMFLKSNLTFCMNPGRLDELRLHQQRAANSCQQQEDSNPQAAVVKVFNSPEPFSSKASLCISLPSIVTVGHNECVLVSHSCWQLSWCQNINYSVNRRRKATNVQEETDWGEVRRGSQRRRNRRETYAKRRHGWEGALWSTTGSFPSLYEYQLQHNWTVQYFNCHYFLTGVPSWEQNMHHSVDPRADELHIVASVTLFNSLLCRYLSEST